MLGDYWLRKGNYGDESQFYDTKHQRWQGVVAMAVGVAVSVYLFANVFGFYVGPIASNVPQIGDITFLVTFALTAALYYAFDMISPRKATAGSRAA